MGCQGDMLAQLAEKLDLITAKALDITPCRQEEAKAAPLVEERRRHERPEPGPREVLQQGSGLLRGIPYRYCLPFYTRLPAVLAQGEPHLFREAYCGGARLAGWPPCRDRQRVTLEGAKAETAK